jgi:hypothetical protein
LTVQADAYTNTATVLATEPKTGQGVSATDTARYFGRTGAEGHTPGFWKTNVDTKNAVAWPRQLDGSLVFDPLQPISSLFAGLPTELASLTLVDGIGLQGGGIEALLRHAISGVLNATHPYVAYPLSALEIVTLTNAAIASGDASTIESLKNRFQGFNELGSDLDANGNIPSPRISVVATSAAEGNTGTSTVLVTIRLSGPALQTVTVRWATANGTATAGSDYAAASGTVTFVRGDSIRTVAITIFGDTANEPNETFTVQLSNATGAPIGTSSAAVTILNDEGLLVATRAAPQPTVSKALSADDVAVALDAARAGWTRMGVDTSGLDAVTVVVADLPGAALGEADGTVIRLDVDAAGWGWATAAARDAGRIDLVTVLAHELGHALGLAHDDTGGVMAPALAPGERRLPAAGPVTITESAAAFVSAPASAFRQSIAPEHARSLRVGVRHAIAAPGPRFLRAPRRARLDLLQVSWVVARPRS